MNLQKIKTKIKLCKILKNQDQVLQMYPKKEEKLLSKHKNQLMQKIK